MFIRLFVARNRYVDDFQLLPIHQINPILNLFVDVSNCFIGALRSVNALFNPFCTYSNMLLYFNYRRNMVD